MSEDSDAYDDQFVYRQPVEPTQDVVPVALIYAEDAVVAVPRFEGLRRHTGRLMH